MAAAPAAEVDAVTVTARWREERLQEAPVSVTVLSGADVRARSISNLSEIAPFTPNLTFDPGTGDTGGAGNAQVFIRGVGQQDFVFTAEPGVGIYVDGVYRARSVGAMMELTDIERVEVLKGPQGTVFGKNSVGGAINVVTRRPSSELGMRASATVGGYGRLDASAAADLPIAPGRLLSKFTVSTSRREGYVDRPAGGSLGDVSAHSAGLQALWTPAEPLQVLLAADYTRRRDRAMAGGLRSVNAGAPLLTLWNMLVGAPTGSIYDARYVPAEPLTDYGTGPNRSGLTAWGVSASAEWRTGGGMLRSITAYREQDADFASDPDFSPSPFAQQAVRNDMHQVSQELQWLGEGLGGRLTYVLGGLYFSEQGQDAYTVRIAPGLYQALESVPAGLIPGGFGGRGNPFNSLLDYDAAVAARVDSRSLALFAHLDYRLSDRLSLAAGLRQTWDRKQVRSRFDRFASGVSVYRADAQDEWDALTPTATVTYRWTPALMTYLSAAKGYKSGGFNGRAQSAFVATRPFDPERVWTYEAGLKTEGFARRLAVDLAVFHSDYDNLQLNTVALDGMAPVVIVANAGSARIRGFELEARAAPAPDLRFNLGVGHLDAEYRRLAAGAAAFVAPSDRLPKTPAWSANIGAEKDLETGLGRLTGRVDYAWRSAVEHDTGNEPLLRQKAYGLVNLRLTLQPAGAPWSASAFVTNLADTRHITNGLSTLESVGILNVNYGRPREWGVRLDYRF